jgi:hypothetical protein
VDVTAKTSVCPLHSTPFTCPTALGKYEEGAKKRKRRGNENAAINGFLQITPSGMFEARKWRDKRGIKPTTVNTFTHYRIRNVRSEPREALDLPQSTLSAMLPLQEGTEAQNLGVEEEEKEDESYYNLHFFYTTK